MADEVTPFRKPANTDDDTNRERWVNGPAMCCFCKHRWEAVAVGPVPHGQPGDGFRCPNCDRDGGVFTGLFGPNKGEAYRVCSACEGEIFCITMERGIRCLACGDYIDEN